jgi:osmotically-inducible protein OsmY
MAQVSTRPDIDIDDDVLNIILHYPPLAADRHHIHIEVQDGTVSLSGHTSNPISRKYLVEKVAGIPGVIGVSADLLYDEASISLNAGQVISPGVLVNVRYGTVLLSGKVPADVDADALAMRVAEIPGVMRVVTTFSG